MTVKKHLRAHWEIAAGTGCRCVWGRLRRRQPAEPNQVFPDRDHFGHLLQPGAHVGRGIARIACRHGLMHRRRRLCPAMSDETIIVRNQGTIFLGGPPLVKAATGRSRQRQEDLGGGDLHARKAGVVDHLAQDDAHACHLVTPHRANGVEARRPRSP